MASAAERWIEDQARLAKPDQGLLVRRLGRRGPPAHRDRDARGEDRGRAVSSSSSTTTRWPKSYLHRSHPTDVARTEQLTFVCHPRKEDGRPEQQLDGPGGGQSHDDQAFAAGCMKGQTMYVLPYMMGHPDSPYAKACVQITDVSYVAVSMRIMTRMGQAHPGEDRRPRETSSRAFHSVGDFDPDKRYIMHFPAGGAGLEHRLRLRRQRPAGQEVLLPAHRLLPGLTAGLAGRAHGHHGHRGHPKGKITYITARLALGLRQDQPGHARVGPSRVQGLDDRATTSPG